MAEPSKTVKYAGNSVGVGMGNALAYFALQWAEYKYGYKFADPVVAMAMGGAIFSVILLEANRVFTGLGKGIAFVFNRIFPPQDGDK